MVVSRWIGGLTDSSRYFNLLAYCQACADGSEKGCVDIGGDDAGLAVPPVNCCFRPHYDQDLSDEKRRWFQNKIGMLEQDHRPDTTVIVTRKRNGLLFCNEIYEYGDAIR